MLVKRVISYSQQHKRWRLEWVFSRQLNPSMINPTFKFGITRTPDGKLPFKYILLWPRIISLATPTPCIMHRKNQIWNRRLSFKRNFTNQINIVLNIISLQRITNFRFVFILITFKYLSQKIKTQLLVNHSQFNKLK